jgi:hypothetical protein
MIKRQESREERREANRIENREEERRDEFWISSCFTINPILHNINYRTNVYMGC